MGRRSHIDQSLAPPLFTVEPVEPRVLLAGVTLITHGFQLSSSFPNWVHTMADAVAAKAGGADVYHMTITGSPTPSVSSFSKIESGPGTNAESVIEVDWGAVADHLSSSVTAGQVGDVILPYLLTYPSAAHPFAELPIHLIGHSRGASVMSWLAQRLAQAGAWVDQLTLLDPHPLTASDIQSSPAVIDPPVAVDDNVVFAENDWETDQSYPHGQSVAGTHSTNLTSLNINHSGVHTYYYGTSARTATSDGDGGTVSAAWYTGDTRATTGFNWSLINGGARPADGFSSLAGSAFSAARTHVALTTNSPWPNIGAMSLIDPTAPVGVVANGDGLNIGYRYQDVNGGSIVRLYLDSDTNPYDGSTPLKTDTSLASTGATPNAADRQVPLLWDGSALSAGLYYIYAAITSPAAQTRYAYLPQALYVTPSEAKLITRRFTGEVSADWSAAGNWTPGGTPTASDRASIQLAAGGHADITAPTAATLTDLALLGGTLNITGGATLNVAGSLDGRGGAIVVGAGSTLTTSSIVVATVNTSGTIVVRSHASPGAATVSRIGQLTFTGAGASLDLANNEVFLTTTPSAVRSLLQSRQLITSSTGGALGYIAADAATTDVRFTLLGDANLDNTVNVADLGSLATAYGLTAGAVWANGDFNYDGTVDVADLGHLATNYGATIAAPVALTNSTSTMSTTSATDPGEADYRNDLVEEVGLSDGYDSILNAAIPSPALQ